MNQEMQASSSRLISASPSLNSYSAYNNTLAEVAARVAQEIRLNDNLAFQWDDDGHQQTLQPYEEEEDEFEFSFLCGNPESSSLVPADEIFHNGKIKPSYFVFAGESSEKCGRGLNSEVIKKPTRRTELRVLMDVDRAEPDSSCSSSETDDLDRIVPETYCVWKPDACNKSRSTGALASASASRRWNLRQLLLKRSNSDSAKTVVLLTAKAVADGRREGGSGELRKETVGGRKSFLPYG